MNFLRSNPHVMTRKKFRLSTYITPEMLDSELSYDERANDFDSFEQTQH